METKGRAEKILAKADSKELQKISGFFLPCRFYITSLSLYNGKSSETPWLIGIMNDSKAIFKAFVGSNHGVNVRIYSTVTHRLTSAWIQKSTSSLVP